MIYFHSIGSNDTLWAAITGPAIRPVQLWPPAGHRVVGLGEALETLSKLNPIFDTFRI